MYSLGKNTKTTFLHREGDKTSQEFAANAAVKRGQPVKLTVDGKVTPWAKADGRSALIGYAYSDAAAGDLVTVFCRGWAIIWALSGAALNAGPVAYASYDAATSVNGTVGYSVYNTGAADTEYNGWNLDQAAGANQLIRILVMG